MDVIKVRHAPAPRRGDGLAAVPGGAAGHHHAPEHDHPHGHDHPQGHHEGGHDHHHELRAMGRRALLGALLLNSAFMIVEALVGLWSGSLALMSDAAHMFADVLALAVALGAASLGTAAARGRYTFGLKRLPVLGGLVNALSSVGLGIAIVVEAVHRMARPLPVAGGPVLIVAALGLAVNIGSALWLHRSGDRGVNARGAMLHMLADALGSVAAIVSGVVLLTTSFTLIDPIVSVLVAGIVVASALPLLRDVVHILLERAPGDLDLAALERAARVLPEVDDVIGLHAWELDSGEAVASIVLVTHNRDLLTLNRAADRLREELRARFHVRHATVEWRDVEQAAPCCVKQSA